MGLFLLDEVEVLFFNPAFFEREQSRLGIVVVSDSSLDGRTLVDDPHEVRSGVLLTAIRVPARASGRLSGNLAPLCVGESAPQRAMAVILEGYLWSNLGR